ncbi:hypothetical protein MS3_00006110 [Schistosoma haematobium]|uniref:Uncharacterized protein n=1 Tax=Schistosoma haematobium TaxID=6185 RepID=A0A6A5DD83_SCHHA|nr:hypothetical protein MS3_00006110 [Schistosoma haematobium]KAH9584550.1 hypothetical protein MS3_00006110 [Schistosoma haematobium]
MILYFIKCSGAKPVGPGFESRRGRGRGCALLKSPILGRNGRPVLPGFPWWSSFNSLMILTIEINKLSSEKRFCRDCSNLRVELMSRFKLNHHGKPGINRRPLCPSMGLLSSVHQWSYLNMSFVDIILDINTIGCRFNCLVIKSSCARLVGLVFESRRGRGRGFSLLRSSIIGRNGRPVLPGFPWWSSFNSLMILTIEINIIHHIIQMFSNHLDPHSDYDKFNNDQNNNDPNKKIINDNYEVNIFQNYTKQYYYIQQFIPSPLLLFTWTKLMRTELFRQTLQNVILSNYDNYIMTRLQSTNSPVNNNNGNDSNGNHTNPDLIDLTHRNALIKKYLNKLNSLLFEYLSSNKDWASSSSSLSSSSSSSTSSSPSLLSSTNIIEPYHQFNVYNNYESRNCLYQWLNQSINCNNLYDDNTLIKNINHESNHLLKLDDNLPLEEATVQFNDENNNNNNNTDFHVDNKYHLDSYRTSFNIPEIYHSKCNPLWSDICCTENYHPELYQNSSIWKQTSSSSSSPSRSLSAAATTPPPPPITDCSLNTKHTIMNSSFISLNKSNFNEIIDDTKLQLQSTTTTTTTTNTIPSISYSPPLNFNEFILDQNMLCPLCHKCFRFEKNLLRHLQKTHATSTGESLLKCKLCNYTTRHYSNMYVHIRTHTG